MIRYLIGIPFLLVGYSYAQNETAKCTNYFLNNSNKPIVLCDYDFGKEPSKVMISKECILKNCEAYKAYEKALTIRNSTNPGEMEHNWGVVNCKNLSGTPTYLSWNHERSGTLRFCKFSDYSFINDMFLDTSRINWVN